MPDPSPALPEPPNPDGPTVTFTGSVTSGITGEVLSALRDAPRGTSETGGILLGLRSGESVLVQDFEPVLCEHRFGPFYILSDQDLAGLEESVGWFRTPQSGPLEVLGYYRSQTRPEPAFDNRDREIMQRFFRAAGSLLVLLKPGESTALSAEPFYLGESGLSAAGPATPFRADGPVSLAVFPPPKLLMPPAPAARETRPSLPPPTRPRRLVGDETVERISRNRGWVAAVAAMTLVGAVLGYRSVGSDEPASPPLALPAQARVSPVSTPAPPKPEPPDSARPLVDSSDVEHQIRAALDEWEASVRSGDADRIAEHYAPRLERYFTERDATNTEVRRAAEQYTSRYGKPAILRISEISIIPTSETRATASFRKHWQTSPPQVFAGEEQERLSLVKVQDAWKIISEEETKVYWTQRPR